VNHEGITSIKETNSERILSELEIKKKRLEKIVSDDEKRELEFNAVLD